MTSAHPPEPPASPLMRPGEVLLDRHAIHAIVRRLAGGIGRRHAGRDLVVLAVLDGALVFTADLLRLLPLRTRLETVRARSYGGARTTPGPLEVSVPDVELDGRHVLIVDDILDTGRTLAALRKRLAAVSPASVEICVLLEKPSRREADVPVDWVGARIPDRFVVGYGLDYDGWFRNLPHIAALEPASPGGRS